MSRSIRGMVLFFLVLSAMIMTDRVNGGNVPSNADAVEPDVDGTTLLMRATSNREVHRIIRRDQSIINAIDVEGHTALTRHIERYILQEQHRNAKEKEVAIATVNALLAVSTIDVNVVVSNGRFRGLNALMISLLPYSSIMITNALLKSPTIELNTIAIGGPLAGQNVLMMACRDLHHVGIVKALLQSGRVDVTLRTTRGLTPLMFAIDAGLEMVKVILPHSNVNLVRDCPACESKCSRTAIAMAAEKGFWDIVEHLLDEPTLQFTHAIVMSGTHLLQLAIDEDRRHVIKKTLSHRRFNPNMPINANGDTALHTIVKIKIGDRASLITDIIGNERLDPNTLNSNGVSALHEAVAIDHVLNVHALLESPRLNVNLLTPDDKTALHLTNSVAIVRMLISHQININQYDNDDNTALHRAVKNDMHQIVRALVAIRTIGVNYGDRQFNTPLHIAVKMNSITMVEIILEHPLIDLSATNEPRKQTAMDLAVMYRLVDIESRLTAAMFTERPLEECSICFNVIDEVDRVRYITSCRCNHQDYHHHCLQVWVGQQSSCPACRQKIALRP